MAIKRGTFYIILLALLLLPLASAEVVVNTQPQSIYNLGDIATLKVTFKPVQTVSGNFQMDLVCGGAQVNFYKNGGAFAAGKEYAFDSSLILIKEIIGDNKGTCNIKAYLGSDFAVTNDFLISNVIQVNSTLPKTEFSPGEAFTMKGTAIKENGNSSNGYIEVSLIDGNDTISTQKGTVNKGAFSVNFVLPEDLKSGNYILRTTAYEEDAAGTITNTGYADTPVFIKQVPTTLELVFEQQENQTENQFMPGTTLSVKAVLHDQTGVGISTDTFITIKNSKNKIVTQTELPTDEFFEFPIAYNEPPSSWKVVAVSNKLSSEVNFQILEKKSVDVAIVNNTVLITNTGNIPYNGTVTVKIGDNPLYVDVYLKVDESKRWLLSAPDGQYDIAINSDSGLISGTAVLTGDAVSIRGAADGIGSLVKFPSIWIFIIVILGLMTFIVFKRGYQKAFIGYITGKPRHSKMFMESGASIGSGAFGIAPKGKAEMVLSIKGDKQEVSMVTLKIKNMAWIKNTKEGTSASELIEKIIDFAESTKAATYENGDNIFFIFAPARTKTFNNETAALHAARKINEMLEHHNKMFKQKIDYGISLNMGEIIGKQEPDGFKFMGMGNFMNSSKKIASFANNNILMGEKITDKLKAMVKTERHEHEGTKVYSIKEIRDTEKHEKFLRGFMKRQGEGK